MNAKELADRLPRKAERVAEHLLPNGTRKGAEWCCGSVSGQAGDSLRVHLTGGKAGVWKDFADEGKGGVPCLFGGQAIPEDARTVVSCEGELDVLALWDYAG